MDKLKQHLAVALQYGFWIGCGCVFLGSLAIWWMSTSRLERENEAQVSAIKTDAGKITSLRAELNDQPNEKSHEKMKALIAVRTDEVLAAWKQIYTDQLGILTWPTELKESYVDEFRYVRDETTGELDKTRRKLPFENFAEPNNPAHEVAPTIRNNYATYIKNVLEDIAAIAKTDWTADFDSNAGGGMGMEMGMGMDMGMDMGRGTSAPVNITGVADVPLVQWSGSSQDSVLSDLFPWRGTRPTTLQVYYSQENLWILKQLLQIVSTVNGNARMPFEAKIREIEQLRIGKSVSLDGIGNIAKPGEGLANRGMGGMGGMDGMDDMGDMYGDEMYGDEMGGMGSTMTTTTVPDPAENRYVDTANQPITAAALRAALTSKAPADAPIAVAKRIPVMLSLQMDQRYVPELIAACGSAALMVEVKQTRILPKGSGGSAGGMGSDMDMGMDDMGMGMGGGGTTMTQQTADEFPLDITVEIYGLIHLYNPPDEEALGIKGVTQETPMVESGALPAPSATTVPATTAPATGTPDSSAPPVDTTTPAPATGTPAPPAAGTTAPAAGPPATGAPATGAPAAGTPAAPPTAIATPN